MSSEPNVAKAIEAPTSFDDPALYENREISWLAFNQRVLDQACDARWPLLERVKFLAIHHANLDEFYMIRVAGLHEQLEGSVEEPNPDKLDAKEQLRRIRDVALAQLEVGSQLFLRELVPALARAGIHIVSYDALDAGRVERAREYFRKSVFPVLTPLSVDPVHPFPFISNLSLSLAVETQDPRTLERRFARVKVPESLPRFVALDAAESTTRPHGPDRELTFITLEDLIAHNLGDLFPGARILGCHAFRVTRDMDLDLLETEAPDLLSLVHSEVRRRRFGAAVRLEVGRDLPRQTRELLMSKLEIEQDDVYESRALLGMSGLFKLLELSRPELKDPSFFPRIPAEWRDSPDPFSAMRASDILLHHPYDSFSPVLELLNAAADDANVLALKLTLYRAGSNAEVVRTLIRAAENGKQVAVSIELKARFDEENNINWARALERAGAHVFYGAAGLKTHAKALLIVRREGSELRRYVHLSTGNYNTGTARLYTDTGLLTTDPAIGEDVTELFNSLSGFSVTPSYRKLAVAPALLRPTILRLIEEQAERARNGLRGRIFAKLNALVDAGVIQALYAASCAGVEIDLVVRGACCLRAGLPGVSERIRVRSLIGRFLEHERLFIFGIEGEERYFLASADWMPRNLDRRVEVLFPVDSVAVRRKIFEECVEPLRLAQAGTYEMGSDGVYRRPVATNGEAMLDAQSYTLGLGAVPSPRRPLLTVQERATSA